MGSGRELFPFRGGEVGVALVHHNQHGSSRATEWAPGHLRDRCQLNRCEPRSGEVETFHELEQATSVQHFLGVGPRGYVRPPGPEPVEYRPEPACPAS